MNVENERNIKTMREAQALVKSFAINNGWKDIPNIDKFDHMHEELLEMSQHLRYKSEEERKKYVIENFEIFVDGIGDLFFGMCRLANQLGVDIENAFNFVQKDILSKYNQIGNENNIVRSSPEVKFTKPIDETLCDIWNQLKLTDELAFPEHMWSVCRVFSKYNIVYGNSQEVTTAEIGPFRFASDFQYSEAFSYFIKSIIPILIKDFCLSQPLSEVIPRTLVFAAELFVNTLFSSCLIEDPIEWEIIIYVKKMNSEGIQPTEQTIQDFFGQISHDINNDMQKNKIKSAIDALSLHQTVLRSKKLEILSLTSEGKYICCV